MYWNYRLIRFKGNDEEVIVIKEVYYNENDEPKAYCDSSVQGENLREIKDTINMMKTALNKPILNSSDFIKDSK